ncbi:MAG: ABC transporter ATP-binding protein [Deltaproteobacteria bacterium]|nr:ABC transporter ATP-binding protein [Deltaproteobacteria bacterium]
MSADVSLVSVEGLRFAYPARRGAAVRPVLDSLSFDVGVGRIVGLLGPNGSGKSTAIGLLAGLLRPLAGTLRLRGEPVPFGDRRLRAETGFVFQQPSLDPRLSSRENLALAARLHALPSSEARRAIDEALALTELAARADDPVRMLSGGMRRRIDLVRALLHAPTLLVLDEPSSGLDEHAFRRVWAHLSEARDRDGLAVLVSTHRPEEADRCDHLMVLDGGRVVARGSPAELRARVRGDVITLEADDVEQVAAVVRERFDLEPTIDAGRSTVSVVRAKGHELVPRIVEGFPAGRLRAVSLRTPTLADVFLALTGRTLDTDNDDAAPGSAPRAGAA